VPVESCFESASVQRLNLNNVKLRPNHAPNYNLRCHTKEGGMRAPPPAPEAKSPEAESPEAEPPLEDPDDEFERLMRELESR
jgi:hypothetical protein